MPQHHTLSAGPKTCHWGFFDARLEPALRIQSGDTVSGQCVSGGPDVLPPGDGFEILPDQLAIHGALQPKLGAHILTGRIVVEGAAPGDACAVPAY